MNAAPKETILSALRHLLTAAGAIAITHGYATDSQIHELVGGAIALLGAVWGPLDEYLAARQIDQDAKLKAAVKAAVDAALAVHKAETP